MVPGRAWCNHVVRKDDCNPFPSIEFPNEVDEGFKIAESKKSDFSWRFVKVAADGKVTVICVGIRFCSFSRARGENGLQSIMRALAAVTRAVSLF